MRKVKKHKYNAFTKLRDELVPYYRISEDTWGIFQCHWKCWTDDTHCREISWNKLKREKTKLDENEKISLD